MTNSTEPTARSNHVRWWAGAVAATVATAVTLVACIPTDWTGDDYTFSCGQMQDTLAHKFPFRRRSLGFFDVTLSNPQVSLDPTRNRIAVQANAVVEGGLSHQLLTGPLAISSGLHYDPPTYSIRLGQPSVDRFDLQDMPDGIGPQINSISSLIAGRLLNDYAVYTFKPDQLKVADIMVEPSTITVLSKGVHIQAKRP